MSDIFAAAYDALHDLDLGMVVDFELADDTGAAYGITSLQSEPDFERDFGSIEVRADTRMFKLRVKDVAHLPRGPKRGDRIRWQGSIFQVSNTPYQDKRGVNWVLEADLT